MKRTYLAAFLLLFYGTVRAADAPSMKEGLWSIHTVDTTNPGNKVTESNSTICRSHAYDEHVQAESKTVRKNCTTVSDSTQGNKHLTELKCQIAGTTIDTRGTVTILDESNVRSETHATYTPAMGGVTDTTMIQEQKYQGSCPAGQAPGDLTTSSGAVNHLWRH